MSGRLGLSSYAYSWASRPWQTESGAGLTPEALVHKAAARGLTAVQICDNLPLSVLGQARLADLASLARDKSILLEVGARGLDAGSLQSHIHIANTLGARVLRIVPGANGEAQGDVDLERVADVLRGLLPLCREQNVTLAIENHFTIRDEELLRLVQDIGDEFLGVCLDTANSTGLLEKPLDTVSTLAPYVVSLHLKDFVITKAAHGYRICGTALGQGCLDAPAVVELISQAGRSPNAFIELWMEPIGTWEDTVHKEDEWVRESIAYARGTLRLH